jgi:hypothetical protein
MRRNVLIFLLVTVAVLGFAVHHVWVLLSLLFIDGSEDAISRAELPAPNSPAISERPQVIPKIIHQTYINESLPEHWKGPQQSCLDLHPDYEYKLWTDKKSREFIAAEYPWFLETFDGYPYPIQRADAIRYFVLHHFGGIYIDLDDVSATTPIALFFADAGFRDATAASTLSLHTQRGCARRTPRAFRTTPWAQCPAIHSSSRQLTHCLTTTAGGFCLILL